MTTTVETAMTITAPKTTRIGQPGPPDMAGPGLAAAFLEPAGDAGAVGDPCGSGVAGADTAGDEVAGADTAGDEVADG